VRGGGGEEVTSDRDDLGPHTIGKNRGLAVMLSKATSTERVTIPNNQKGKVGVAERGSFGPVQKARKQPKSPRSLERAARPTWHKGGWSANQS